MKKIETFEKITQCRFEQSADSKLHKSLKTGYQFASIEKLF